MLAATTEPTDWQRINSLPDDIRRMALMSFSLLSLKEAYPTKQDRVLKTLSDLTFWREKLEREGYLDPSVDNDAWLKSWIDSADAVEMVDYLSNQLFALPNLGTTLEGLLEFNKFIQTKAITGSNISDPDLNLLGQDLLTINQKMQQCQPKFDAIKQTWEGVKWVHRNFHEDLQRDSTRPNFINLPDMETNDKVTKLSFEQYLAYWNDLIFSHPKATNLFLSGSILADYTPKTLNGVIDKDSLLSFRLRLLLDNLRKYDYGITNQRGFIVMPDEQGKLTIYLSGEDSPICNYHNPNRLFLPYQALEMLKAYQIHGDLWPGCGFNGIMTPEGPLLLTSHGQEYNFEGWTLIGLYIHD